LYDNQNQNNKGKEEEEIVSEKAIRPLTISRESRTLGKGRGPLGEEGDGPPDIAEGGGSRGKKLSSHGTLLAVWGRGKNGLSREPLSSVDILL